MSTGIATGTGMEALATAATGDMNLTVKRQDHQPYMGISLNQGPFLGAQHSTAPLSKGS